MLLFVFSLSCFTLFVPLKCHVYDYAHPRCGDVNLKARGFRTLANDTFNKCYQLIDKQLTWVDAQQYCRNSIGPSGTTGSGSLTNLQTTGELEMIRQWLRFVGVRSQGVWIGADRCIASLTGFCWANQFTVDISVTSFNFWAPAEPIGTMLFFIETNCVYLQKKYSWAAGTMPCDFLWHNSFICEFPMNAIPTSSTTTPKTSTSTSTSTTTSTPPATSKMAVNVKKAVFDSEGEPSSWIPSTFADSSLMKAMTDLLLKLGPKDSTIEVARPTISPATSTETPENKAELPSTSWLLIGLFVGIAVMAGAFGIVAYMFWKRMKVHPINGTTIVNVIPAADANAISSTLASKHVFVEPSLELVDGDKTRSETLDSELANKQNEMKEESAKTSPPPYSH